VSDRSRSTDTVPFAEMARTRLSRRTALKGAFLTTAGAAAAGTAVSSPFALLAGPAEAATGETGGPSTLGFEELEKAIADDHRVSPGHTAQVLIRWGDPVLPGAPAFDPKGEASAAAQEKQFGYNNDYVGYLPLPLGANSSDHGLLFVSHEYTNTELMFPGLDPETVLNQVSKEQADTEMAAHGASVIEIRKENGAWTVVPDSEYARRISFLSTPMEITGPAAGHDRMKTSADSTGRTCIGTLNNCAGGKTPWGTVLSAEENFHQYFAGDPSGTPEAESHARYGIKGDPRYAWGRYHDRMDVSKEPNEPNRFGWLVEVDPYDPEAAPKKRTAMGRFRHEAGTTVVNPDGTVTVYSGDDQRFEYLYRFVTAGTFDPENRAANMDLLDEGTLSVAKFAADGTLRWLPLVHGEGPLTAENGFASQAEVLIETRRAADLLGATPMDRPEDVDVNPVNGRVYMMLTNNTRRTPEQTDAVNPRPDNAYGHIVELTAGGGAGPAADHTAETYFWDILLLAGDPSEPSSSAKYHPDVSKNGWLAAPDNCAFDTRGRLWISTDQGSAQAKRGNPDGMYACDVDGPGRALTKFFYGCPRDAEMCGPEFTPDGTTLFVAVQHPGEGKGSSFANPSTRFPDFQDGMPPRPSVVAIMRDDGGVIGG